MSTTYIALIRDGSVKSSVILLAASRITPIKILDDGTKMKITTNRTAIFVINFIILLRFLRPIADIIKIMNENARTEKKNTCNAVDNPSEKPICLAIHATIPPTKLLSSILPPERPNTIPQSILVIPFIKNLKNFVEAS